MRLSLGPSPPGSCDSPCEARRLASILPQPSLPAFLRSEAGTTETARQGGGWRLEQAPRTGLCRAAAPPSPSAWPRPASQLPQHISMFPLSVWGRCFFPPPSQEKLLRPWLGDLGCLLLPCLFLLWRCPLRLSVCCNPASPPSPGHGPSGPPTVTLPPSLSIRLSHPTPQFNCLLLPPHAAHLLDFSWAAVPTLHDV